MITCTLHFAPGGLPMLVSGRPQCWGAKMAAGMTGPPASVTFFMRKVKGPPGSNRRSTPIGSVGSFTMIASRR